IRTLQRSARRIVPHALQVRVTPGRFRHCTRAHRRLLSSRFRRLSCEERGGEGCDHHRQYRESAIHFATSFANFPYSICSVNGTHLNSSNWTFFSIRRYRGKLIFHGRVYTFGSSIVASYIK